MTVSAHELQHLLGLTGAQVTQHCETLDHYGLGYLQEDYPEMILVRAPTEYLYWEGMLKALKALNVDLETLLQLQDFSIFDR